MTKNIRIRCKFSGIFEFIDVEECGDDRDSDVEDKIRVKDNEYVMYYYVENFNDHFHDQPGRWYGCFQSIKDDDAFRDAENLDYVFHQHYGDHWNSEEFFIKTKSYNNEQIEYGFSMGIDAAFRVKSNSLIKFDSERDFQHFIYKYLERNKDVYQISHSEDLPNTMIVNINVQQIGPTSFRYVPDNINILNNIDDRGYDASLIKERTGL